MLRNFNPGTNVTGVDGLITGKHALVRNVLATKQPFAQAAQGTFHFRQDNAPLEAQPNEADDIAEPAEYLDTSNMYSFINYLLEYVDVFTNAMTRCTIASDRAIFPMLTRTATDRSSVSCSSRTILRELWAARPIRRTPIR